MSLFLQNLISRHQDAGTDTASSPVVQPRPKARFESRQSIEKPAQQETNHSTDFGQNDAYQENQTNNSHDRKKLADTDQSSITQAQKARPSVTLGQQNITPPIDISQQARIETTTDSSTTQNIAQSTPMIRTDHCSSQTAKKPPIQLHKKPVSTPHSKTNHVDLNQRITALSRRLGQKNLIKEPAIDSEQLQKQNIIQSEGESQFPEIDSPANRQRLLLVDDLQQRIHIILQRINTQQPQQTAQVGIDESLQDQYLTNTDNDIRQKSEQTASQAASHLEIPHPVAKVIQPNIQESPGKVSEQQSGLLQSPQWLSELQTSLNSHIQQHSTQAQTEPVIHVTIGRVEVKAVKDNAVTQPKPRNKPKAAMSLDDYLQQRSGKGYA